MNATPVHRLAHEEQRLQQTILSGNAPGTWGPLNWIRPKPDFAAQDQIAVYVNAYHSRLYEAAIEDFPVLQHYLGDNAFSLMLHDYVSRTQSSHFNIARYSMGLPGHVVRMMPHDLLAQQLAVLEDAICQLQDASESFALTHEHLAGVTGEALQHAVVAPRLAARLLAFDYPVDAYFTAVREDQTPAAPMNEKSWLLVYRHDDVVWRMPLEEPEFLLLQSMADGMSVGEACDALASVRPDQTLSHSVTRWFARWMRNGVLRHPIQWHEVHATV